ncbi:MAG TPA: hypothetical protein VKA55_00980 [Gammaproteobacteria bacterium]|nr:hypothetical protein [Gammaproteobacteria bacterium]
MAVELLDDTAAIRRRLDELAGEGPLAPVAPEAPLLANLSARENVALVGAFHGRLPEAELDAAADALLQRLGVGGSGGRRPAELGDREAFLVQMGRAAMRPEARLVVVTPFTLMPELESDAPVAEALAAVGAESWDILDYATNAHRYRSLAEALP